MSKANMITIIVNTSFEGFHKYDNAPEEVSYLRNMHRHVFHVNVEMEVYHDNRELEFIMVKHTIDEFIQEVFIGTQGVQSCEQIGEKICKYLTEQYGERKIICTVLEDNENGGRTYYGF